MGNWIEWHGGECPLPAGTWFEYRLRSGGTGAALNNPTAWDWSHHSCAGVGPAMTAEAARARGEYDIIAYRVPTSELPPEETEP
jgi:hypothetical protein